MAGAARYEYAIGTSSGAADVLAYTSAGTATSVTRTGLSLANGTTYFVTVRACDAGGSCSTAASSNGVLVDALSPTVSLSGVQPLYATSQPSGIGANASDSGGSGLTVTFQYRAAGAASFTDLNTVAAPGPYSLSWGQFTLADGSYEVRATARDGAGNVSTSDASFTVDTAPPTIARAAILASGSVGYLRQGEAYTVYAQITDAGTGVQSASVDLSALTSGATAVSLTGGGPFSVGGQSYNFSASATANPVLSDGARSFTVTARDGTTGSSNTSSLVGTATLDNTPPETVYLTGPSGSTTSTSASFTFSASESTATFECSLDSAAYAACVSGVTYSGLALGSHTFSVRARDAAGNLDLSPHTVTWSIVPPPTPIPTPVPPPPDTGGGDGGGGGGGGSSTTSTAPAASPAPAPTVAPTPTPTPAPLNAAGVAADAELRVGGLTQLGSAVQATLPPGGGQVTTPDGGIQLVVPAEATGGAQLAVDLRRVALPAAVASTLPAGFRLGETMVQVTLANQATGQVLHEFSTPLSLVLRATPADLQRADGDPNRLKVVFWDGASLVPQPCSTSGRAATCSVAHLSVFGLMVIPAAASEPLDVAIPGGLFYRQANGFDGRGPLGYAVVDDGAARFWTELQRYGGVQRVGYPISGRFQHRGFLTQAFQKLALQWRPDLGRAVPVNVLDDLNQAGVDRWLDEARQVPPAADTDADQGLSFEEVVQRHVAFLDPYPALREFYLGTEDWLTSYGLPLAVKDYGTFVTVRLQRGTLQLWKVDVPWASAGQVVVGNGADIAKEAGLWPASGLALVAP